jgi:four helix bundle protein
MANGGFGLSRTFPREEQYSLTDQVRRSSRSVGAQIAEARAKRRYPAHFVSKLTDSDGERNETVHWLGVARDCGYISQNDAEPLLSLLDEIGRMLRRMIERADDFSVGPAVRETPAPYGSLSDFFLSDSQ